MAARAEAARRKRRQLQAPHRCRVAGRGRPRRRDLDRRGRAPAARRRRRRRSPPRPAASARPRPRQWTAEPEPERRQPAPQPSAADLKDVGTAADRPAPARPGTQVMTFEHQPGQIKVEMDLAKTPVHRGQHGLPGQQEVLRQHRLPPAGHPGDLTRCSAATRAAPATGGPTYTFADENLPDRQAPAYHAGDVAMANTGSPSTNGSQFFFVYDDSDAAGRLHARGAR